MPGGNVIFILIECYFRRVYRCMYYMCNNIYMIYSELDNN